MDLPRIKRVHHFYYCLLIAVKMYRRERGRLNKIEENSFIYCWLNKATKNKIFDRALQVEIDWLSSQLRGHGIRSDIGPMVENIFVKLDHLLCMQEESTT